MFTSARAALLAAAIPALIFLGFSLHNLSREHANSDESAFGSLAVAMMAHDNSHLRHVTTTIPFFNGTRIPVNVMRDYTYTGATFLLLPALLITEPSLILLRVLPVLFAAMGIFLLFFIIAHIWGKRTAAATALLLSLSPTFIHYARSGLLTTEPLINALFIISLFLFLRGMKKDSTAWLCAASFAAGLCISIKFSAAAYYAGFLFAAGLAYAIGKLRVSLTPARIACYALFFLCGAGLFVYHNAVTGGSAFQGLISTSPAPVTFNEALAQRAHHFCALVKEKEPGMETVAFTLNSSRVSMVLFILFWCACAANMFEWVRSIRKGDVDLRLPLAVIFFGTVFVCSACSPGSLRPVHLSMLYPFPQLMAGLLVTRTIPRLTRKYAAPISIAVLCLFIFCQSALVLKFQRFYASQTGDQEYGIRTLIAELSRLPSRPTAFLNADTDEAVYYLSRGAVASNRIALAANAAERTVLSWADDTIIPGSYLVTSNKTSLYAVDDTDKLAAISQWVKHRGMTMRAISTIPGTDGQPLHTIYTIEPHLSSVPTRRHAGMS